MRLEERNSVVCDLQTTNTILADLLQRVTKTESRIKVIEEKVGEARATGRSTGSRTRDVPDVVRIRSPYVAIIGLAALGNYICNHFFCWFGSLSPRQLAYRYGPCGCSSLLISV